MARAKAGRPATAAAHHHLLPHAQTAHDRARTHCRLLALSTQLAQPGRVGGAALRHACARPGRRHIHAVGALGKNGRRPAAAATCACPAPFLATTSTAAPPTASLSPRQPAALQPWSKKVTSRPAPGGGSARWQRHTCSACRRSLVPSASTPAACKLKQSASPSSHASPCHRHTQVIQQPVLLLPTRAGRG